MKRIILKLSAVAMSCILIIIFSASAVSAESSHSWYIRRNGNLRPSFPPDAEELAEYGCYYIDKNVSDCSDKKKLYITFDVGYANGNVEKILDVLKEENVPAAFFVLDNIILKNTDLVRRMKQDGHLICNHTKNHKDLSFSDKDAISNDLSALEKIYEDSTGMKMSKYFRFPEGKYSLNAVKCVNELGYKTVFWSFAYDDWDNTRQMSPEKAIRKVISNTHNGAVMLFHPTSDTNAEIFKELINLWRSNGYEFCTLDELTK